VLLHGMSFGPKVHSFFQPSPSGWVNLITNAIQGGVARPRPNTPSRKISRGKPTKIAARIQKTLGCRFHVIENPKNEFAQRSYFFARSTAGVSSDA
jgi:hypothetical protein